MNIHDCCRNGNLSEVRRALASGVNVDLKDNFEMTSLHLASRYGYVDIVKELLKYGADINSKVTRGGWRSDSGNGMTPLMLATQYNKIEIVKLLLEYCDPSIKNNKWQTALDYARTDEIRQLIAEAIEFHENPLDLKEPEGA